MSITVLLMFYTKQKHDTVFYRTYKTSESKKSMTQVENELMKFDISNIEFQTLDNILSSVLIENVPLKQKMQALLPKIWEKLLRKDHNWGIIYWKEKLNLQEMHVTSNKLCYSTQKIKSILVSKSRLSATIWSLGKVFCMFFQTK